MILSIPSVIIVVSLLVLVILLTAVIVCFVIGIWRIRGKRRIIKQNKIELKTVKVTSQRNDESYTNSWYNE